MNDIAVIIPCHNEGTAIEEVVKKFREYFLSAQIYVYDNASTDNTAEVARNAGAVVRTEPMKGKGNVIRRMFADVEADIYVMVDGDGTYDSSKCPEMIQKLIENKLDMVVGVREAVDLDAAYRKGHVLGNWMLTYSVSFLFEQGFTDMLSGYRVMSRRFVKSFPVLSKGFEIETEMTVHALQIGASADEIVTPYYTRSEGSESKLSTYRDGLRILKMILLLFKEVKPFQFFGLFSLLFFLASVGLSMPLLFTWLETGLVPRFPTAILSMGLMLLSFFSLVSGVILDSVSRGRLEEKRMRYLTYFAPSGEWK
jgi:glycosyltransferase involved in cell wall biosynthesis